MTHDEIKAAIQAIIEDGSGMVYTDAGNGSGGPGYAGPAALTDMLAAGEFEDAALVETDTGLLVDAFESVSLPIPLGDIAWRQIEFAWGEGDNPHHMIGWIWG